MAVPMEDGELLRARVFGMHTRTLLADISKEQLGGNGGVDGNTPALPVEFETPKDVVIEYAYEKNLPTVDISGADDAIQEDIQEDQQADGQGMPVPEDPEGERATTKELTPKQARRAKQRSIPTSWPRIGTIGSQGSGTRSSTTRTVLSSSSLPSSSNANSRPPHVPRCCSQQQPCSAAGPRKMPQLMQTWVARSGPSSHQPPWQEPTGPRTS